MTKDQMIENLQAYSINPDDDTCRIKNNIKAKLLNCPELLYALNNKEYEHLLFKDSEINEEGEWNVYFGELSNIKPFLFIPETQSVTKNYLCYQVGFEELLRYDDNEKACIITFTIFVHGNNVIDELTGIPRHDLIGSIIREKIAWSDIATARLVPISDKEHITDNKYVVRTMSFRAYLPNNMTETKDGISRYTNKKYK